MKKYFVVACLLVSSVSFAQRPARTVASYGDKAASISLGMTSSALNIGGRMEFSNEQGAFGGYVFLQTEKKDAQVPQILSFGGHSLIKLVDASNVSAFIAPGIGISMTKMDGADDKTVVGPSFRYGGQIKLPRGAGALGLERMEIWNWFDSDSVGSAAITSAVYTFNF
ncbi:MAG: hypothetical protein OM95_04595 [Bdellovibrio sp. ArHS]|uniref:hypothetical protein n=1 Tax=Bdellovibrio sp. ArHS TaxID=1569284 RepID=UPI0005823C91|nr:hypothetical protein [Bdellovibrio sp. ArHS]KHD89113.1 MAG: hypothetical protein OM95_04595 [Bdellovibrio sp. ArHS]